jgi:hypothetical protein
MAMTHIQFLEQMLVGRQPIRYNRYKNRLYIDMDWNIVTSGDYIVAEAYEVIDPDTYIKVWSDRWLQKFATCLIKQQWGNNLKKYSGMTMPGGIKFNGQQIYDEANQEREKMEQDMITGYSLPVTDLVG